MAKFQLVDRSDPEADADLADQVSPQMEVLLRELHTISKIFTDISFENFQKVMNPVIEANGSGKTELVPIVAN